MTSDSRSCKDSSSVSFQNLRSTAHRPLLLLYLLLPSCTLPKPPSWKYKTALPHSSGSSHRWLAHLIRLLDIAPSLHPFVGDFSATTRCSAPESPLPYSRPCGSATRGFSVRIGVSGSHVPLNRLFGKLRPPLMPDATSPVNRFRRSLIPQ